MKPEFVYKVCSVDDSIPDVYHSFLYKRFYRSVQNVFNDFKPYDVTYKLNEWSSPRIEKSPLYAFSDLRKAEEFSTSLYDYRALRDNGFIFKCEYEPYESFKLLDGLTEMHNPIMSFASPSKFEGYWKAVNNIQTRQLKWIDIPDGRYIDCSPRFTILCSRIKLIEKIS